VKKIAKSNPAKAQNYLERANNHYLITHNRTENIKEYLQVFFSKSNAYIALENYEELIEYSQSCLEKFSGHFISDEDKHILYTKGLGYWHLKDYKKMFPIFVHIKKKFSESDLGPKLVFAIEHGLAVYYESEFKEDKASYHYCKAYEHYLKYKLMPWAIDTDDKFLAMLKKRLKYSILRNYFRSP
jgi:tetratricopeptide (TPR) repeat protein